MRITELSREKKDGLFIVGGSSNPELANDIAISIGVDLGPVKRKKFPSGEIHTEYIESVRGKHVFIILAPVTTEWGSVNDALMEAWIMTSAAKIAGAREITLIQTCEAYGRQDKKSRNEFGKNKREPVTAQTVMNIAEAVGVNNLITIDAHTPQSIYGFRGGSVDNIMEPSIIGNRLKEIVAENPADYVVVSPDEGRKESSKKLASDLGVKMIHLDKVRDATDSSKIMRDNKVTGVENKIGIILDDMIDTGGTLASAATELEMAGMVGIIACATHGIFTDPASKTFRDKPIIKKIIVTDTLPQFMNKKSLSEVRTSDNGIEVVENRLEVLSVAPLLGRVIVAIARDESVTAIQ